MAWKRVSLFIPLSHFQETSELIALQSDYSSAGCVMIHSADYIYAIKAHDLERKLEFLVRTYRTYVFT